MARHQLVTGRWIAGKPYLGKAVATSRTATSEAHPATHTKLRKASQSFAVRCRESASSAFRARRALRFPLLLGPLQEVFSTGTAQMRAAVHDHHLAIDVAAAIRDQE